ncbi:MAG TPA: polyphosphate kinase 1, partial [Spirochaetales bacterium]|nr:polyphosphate kinase 1 [Spirochaetales bacterium]
LVVHAPYESFGTVLDFIDSAARDKATLAIKITLYRTSSDSPIIASLTKAVRAGKQVTVVLELKARFEEERNLAWANRLERAGVIVVYGAARLKVHAKAALVVRKEEDGQVRRYTHLSTGNYNDKTARLYGDLSLLSSSPDLTRDVSSFFNAVTGLSSLGELRHLAMAPFDLKRRLVSMIDREAERSSPESPGLIMAKLNSLGDKAVIDALYRASQKGVNVLLNVRGVCQLVPGLGGLSENIQVLSIVGRFLEHSRIVYFRNGGMDELYLSSADWMPRNLDRRVELMFPVLEPQAKERILFILSAYFEDTAKARSLGPSGRWTRVPVGDDDPLSAQELLAQEAARRMELQHDNADSRDLK